jgi:hypothetical protein
MNYKRLCKLFLILALLCCPIGGFAAENIDPNDDGSQFAWGENVGWLNLEPGGDGGLGVEVGNNVLSGYIWGENIGWINLSPTEGGVFNDGNGNLFGHAWGENVGWINFDPTGGGVSSDACGDFNGTAWGENIGWISFRSDGVNPFYVRTSWVSPIDDIAPVTEPDSPLQEWYNSDVTISLSATDCGSGIQEIRYILDGGGEVITSGASGSVSVTGEGDHTLTYRSVDQAGNIESSTTVTIRIDKTPPTIIITSPADGATYQINETLSANYGVTDTGGSGVVSTTAPYNSGDLIDTSTVGAFIFTVSATDLAGNAHSVTHSYTVAYPGNIDPVNDGSQFAWGENVGWINLKPSYGPGVTVTYTAVTGYAWGENVGWINLSPSDGGVINDGTGELSGYGWGENVGWISFSCENTGTCDTVDYGVTIDRATGEFSGRAWGENIGWITFRSSGAVAYGATTSWRGPLDFDGDGYNYDVDCDDKDVSVNPAATEVPYNGKDDDCNAATADEYESEILATEPSGFWFSDIAIDPAGGLAVAVGAVSRSPCDSYIGSLSQEGVFSIYAAPCIDYPGPLDFNPDGQLFFEDGAGYWDDIYTVPRGGTAVDVELFVANAIILVRDIAFGPNGYLYSADIYRGQIFQITPEGTVSVFASGFTQGDYSYDPKGFLQLAFDSDGTLYVADGVRQTIYKVSSEGVVTPFVTGLGAVSGIAFTPSGDLLATVWDTGEIYSISPGGTLSTWASGLDSPRMITTDSDGTIYFIQSSPNGTANEIVKIASSNGNGPPVFNPIGSEIVWEGNELIINVNAIDPDSDSLTYRVDTLTLPAGANFDSVTQRFSWTPTNAQSGTYFVTFSVNDGYNPDVEERVEITVMDNVPGQTRSVTKKKTVRKAAKEIIREPTRMVSKFKFLKTELETTHDIDVSLVNADPPNARTTVNTLNGCVADEGFRVAGSCFNVTTDAISFDSAEICLELDEGTVNPYSLKLEHYDAGLQEWVPITTSVETRASVVIICGVTDTLSPFFLTINNLPAIGEIMAPLDPQAVETPVTISATFTDANSTDTHEAQISWGDENTTAAIVDKSSEPFMLTGTYAYTVPGIYTVTIVVSDGFSGDSKELEYIVVYDPYGGFVTGGGWITSPVGAYLADPSLTGKANFGFVSKYKKGADVPTGQTEFQFRVADLNFHSSSYEWLVVTGSDYAKFKGSGTINGGDDYKFMLWAGDSNQDTFRIRIWTEDEATGAETDVYDNGFDQEIGGGSIVIHTGK